MPNPWTCGSTSSGTRIDRDYARGTRRRQFELDRGEPRGNQHGLRMITLVRRHGIVLPALAAPSITWPTPACALGTDATSTRWNLEDSRRLPQLVRNHLGQQTGSSMNLVIPTGRAAADHGLLVRYTTSDRCWRRSSRPGSGSASSSCAWDHAPLPVRSEPKGLGRLRRLRRLALWGRGRAVLPCSSCPDPVGNLLHQEFSEITPRTKARQYRHKSFGARAAGAVNISPVCHGACPLYWQSQSP